MGWIYKCALYSMTWLNISKETNSDMTSHFETSMIHLWWPRTHFIDFMYIQIVTSSGQHFRKLYQFKVSNLRTMAAFWSRSLEKSALVIPKHFSVEKHSVIMSHSESVHDTNNRLPWYFTVKFYRHRTSREHTTSAPRFGPITGPRQSTRFRRWIRLLVSSIAPFDGDARPSIWVRSRITGSLALR